MAEQLDAGDVMAKLRETILCLQALAAHVKALKAVLTVVVVALERTKKLLDEATLGGRVSLASLDAVLSDLDVRLVEDKVNVEALKARHVLPLSFGARSEALRGVERSAVLEGIDPSLRANREEMAALDDVVRSELRVPVGHTPYSWYGTTGRTPIGHTAYSSPPMDGAGFSYGEVSLLVTGAMLLVATAVRNRTKVSVVQKVSSWGGSRGRRRVPSFCFLHLTPPPLLPPLSNRASRR